MKPNGLKETTILMCIFNLCAFAFYDSNLGAPLLQIALFAIIIGVSYFVLWQYWLGKKWARILVIITSIIALINLADLQAMNLYAQVVVVAEAILGIFLLYWLNTSKVKQFFKQSQSNN